ncbi:MAG: hypothetical protein COZ70_05190 [Deltaproteobacteria bacterium CG_4_8_14_3_um_filter_51_11]|nr:MAG: hypothetical protein COZ70_05190 [Deltaproteobacteria bacterium CG_4_8_14_3_um_filter_51_11]PIY21815.1 MAG: hypothetical protein COZ11_15035 [Deltaproteobacteria bacterium CG_4_10_14_3_um_filter_51_14]
MKITPTLPSSPLRGRDKGEGAFSYKRSWPIGKQRRMRMPLVIPDLIRNPGVKDWIPAYAGMTMCFHIKGFKYMTEREGQYGHQR